MERYLRSTVQALFSKLGCMQRYDASPVLFPSFSTYRNTRYVATHIQEHATARIVGYSASAFYRIHQIWCVEPCRYFMVVLRYEDRN